MIVQFYEVVLKITLWGFMFNVIKIEMKVEQPRNNNTRRQNSQFHFDSIFTSEISRCKSYKYVSDFVINDLTKKERKKSEEMYVRRQSIAHMGG